MNDHRTTVRIEYAEGTWRQRNAAGRIFQMPNTTLVDLEIGQITHVERMICIWIRTTDDASKRTRIEMTTGATEGNSRIRARPVFMNMNAVPARWKAYNMRDNFYGGDGRILAYRFLRKRHHTGNARSGRS